MQLSKKQNTILKNVLSGERLIAVFGVAGSGKSTLLKEITQTLRGRKKNVAVLAPTGVAASNVGGATFFSFFSIPFHQPFAKDDERLNLSLESVFSLKRKQIRIIQKTHTIIIDEISMVRADYLDVIDHILRKTCDPFAPFGGKQVLFFGDCYQLAPIADEKWDERMKSYASPWFFSSSVWEDNSFEIHLLEKTFRQSDEEFIDFLSRVRTGVVSEEEVLQFNNAHYAPGFYDPNYIALCTHNKKANAINQKALKKLHGVLYRFSAEIDGHYPESKYPLAPEQLELKVGSRVMVLKNMPSKNLINGTMGRVDQVTGDEIIILPDNSDREVAIKRETWENVMYRVIGNLLDIHIIGSYKQFPLRLANAISIHKSQGLQFDRAVLDLRYCFSFGQAYVALSRLKSLNGLKLISKLKGSAIKIDPEVGEFFEKLDREKKPQKTA